MTLEKIVNSLAGKLGNRPGCVVHGQKGDDDEVETERGGEVLFCVVEKGGIRGSGQ